MIQREQSSDGTLRLSTERCSYTVSRLRPGALRVTATGQETGELSRAAIGEVAVEAAHYPPLRLFFDLSGLTRIEESVSNDWTAWFRANQHAIRKIDILTGSLFVKLTVAVSQVFSRTGDLMRVHKDAASFDAALREEEPTQVWHPGKG